MHCYNLKSLLLHFDHIGVKGCDFIYSTLVFRGKNIFYILFFLQNPENKLKVSEIYLEHYKTIMYDFMTDDQELDVSIANLSVQIFTVPSVAHHLIEKQDCLTKMVEFFTQIFEDEAKYGIVHHMSSRILNLRKKIHAIFFIVFLQGRSFRLRSK